MAGRVLAKVHSLSDLQLSLLICALALVLLSTIVLAQVTGRGFRFEAEAGIFQGQASIANASDASGGSYLNFTSVSSLFTPMANCQGGNTVPAGQANPSIEAEPMGLIWCFNLSTPSITRVKDTNSWVDEFDTNVQMQRLNNGDMDYTVLDAEGSVHRAKRFVNANHWMTDFAGVDGDGYPPYDFGGTAMRPNMQFMAENGQLTIEADVATRIPEYGANLFWPEFTVTTAPQFTGPTSYGAMIRRNGTYVYEMFPNHWTLGCRLQNDGGFTCALLDDSEEGDTQARVFELSHFQCGNVDGSNYADGYRCSNIYGGLPSNLPTDIRPYLRQCNANEMDMHCRDRFRWEIRNDRMTWYVNGVKYMEHTGFQPGARAAIDNLLTQPVFVYFGEFMFKLDQPARSHWDRLAINPKDSHGRLMPPTRSPSFCLGEPRNTCPMIFNTDPTLPLANKTELDILDFVYDSPNVFVKAGQTVTWTNRSANGLPHSVTSVNGQFDSGIFGPGGTYSHTFNTPGVYEYYCLPHPSMRGKVTVIP